MAARSELPPESRRSCRAFEKLSVEQEFATQMLTAANASLEQARTDAQKQQFYL